VLKIIPVPVCVLEMLFKVRNILSSLLGVLILATLTKGRSGFAMEFAFLRNGQSSDRKRGLLLSLLIYLLYVLLQLSIYICKLRYTLTNLHTSVL